MESIVDFSNAIQRELAWRKTEISNIRTEAHINQNNISYVFRAGQVLLCAHWEGFIKKSSQLYIDHIFSQDLLLKDLTSNIAAIAYFGDVLKAAGSRYPGSDEHHMKLAEKIISTINNRISKPSWNVHAEGNPGSSTLNVITKTIGIDPKLGMDAALWATTTVFIDDHLVKNRHKIAHGEGIPVSKDEILERSQRLLSLLDRFSEQILDAASNKVYLK